MSLPSGLQQLASGSISTKVGQRDIAEPLAELHVWLLFNQSLDNMIQSEFIKIGTAVLLTPASACR